MTAPPPAVALRDAATDEAPRVAALAARLFTETYGPTHPEPELARYLARAFGADAVRSELADPRVRVILAEVGGAPVGYTQLRTIGGVPAGVAGVRPVEIARFYVDARWHGRGVARPMMDAAVAGARAWGGDVLWLAVWQQAARPLAFYRRVGFAIVGATTFTFGDRQDDDWVMARPLVEGRTGAALAAGPRQA